MVDDAVGVRNVPLPAECPILVLDETDHIVSSNEAAQHLLGLSEDQLREKYCVPIQAPTDDALAGISQESSAGAKTWLFCRVEGDQVFIHGSSVNLHPVVEGRRLTVVVLNQLCSGAFPNGRLSDTALGDLAHAVRTPLCSILGYLDLLADQHKTIRRAELGKTLQTLRHNARWIEHLVDNLLSELRLSVGRLSIAVAPVTLAGLMEDAAVLTEMLGAGKNGRLTLVMPDEEALVLVDRNLVLQVLVNVLANASKRVPLGAQITVGVSGNDEFWQVTIADDSSSAAWWVRPFASDEERPIVLKPHRIHDDLSIILAKAVVELHGGAVGIDSTLGRGNRFWFTLPAHKARPAASRGNLCAEAETARVRAIAIEADGLGKAAIDPA